MSKKSIKAADKNIKNRNVRQRQQILSTVTFATFAAAVHLYVTYKACTHSYLVSSQICCLMILQCQFQLSSDVTMTTTIRRSA